MRASQPRSGFAEGFGAAEVAGYGVGGEAFEGGEVAGLASEEAELCALSGVGSGYVIAYEAGGACEEDFHLPSQSRATTPAA